MSPLMLDVMTLAYRGVAAENIPRIDVVGEQQKHLFDTYIKRMFEGARLVAYTKRLSKQLYPQEQATRWLAWLAQRMRQESQTIFLIERMQPTWLQNQAQQRLYRLQGGVLFLLGLRAWLSGGMRGGLNNGLTAEIRTLETFRDRKSTRLNSSHSGESRMPSSA